jgi:hypothetical protein
LAAFLFRKHPECAAMDSHKLAIPLLAFAGGAILGRLLGLKMLMRGAMTAAAFTGMTSQPALAGPTTHRTNGAHRRKPARSAARRSPAKRSSA